MSNPMQDQANQLRNMLFEDLSKGQSRVFEGLVMNAPVNQLPEPIFVQYFLAGFAGNHPNPNWVVEWISVAGSPSAEVSIIDPSSGQELFRVPAIIASTEVVLQGKSKGRINDIFAHSGNISQNSPLQAATFVNRALNEKNQELQSLQLQEVGVRWRNIFTRYGLAPADPPPTASPVAEDFFDY